MNYSEKDFDAALANFVKLLNEKLDKEINESHPGANAHVYVRSSRKSKYVAIDRHSYGSVSVHCFVVRKGENMGDIMKAASYKAVAKHARGSIFDSDNGMSAVNLYGAKYL